MEQTAANTDMRDNSVLRPALELRAAESSIKLLFREVAIEGFGVIADGCTCVIEGDYASRQTCTRQKDYTYQRQTQDLYLLNNKSGVSNVSS
jgi:hypothetical protein